MGRVYDVSIDIALDAVVHWVHDEVDRPGLDEPTLGLHADSDWEWAWSHRRRFTDPYKDFLGGAVLGVIAAILTGLATAKPGESVNWKTGAVVGLVSAVVTAVLLPVAEALWILVRNRRAVDEAESLRSDLNAASSKRDEYQRSADGLSATVVEQHQTIEGLRRHVMAVCGERDRYYKQNQADEVTIGDLNNIKVRLEARLNRTQADHTVAAALTEKYKEGIELANWSPVLVDDDFREFRSLTKKWSRETYDLMKSCNCETWELAAFNGVLATDVKEAPVFGSEFKDQVERWRNGFCVRVASLRRVINRYADTDVMGV